MVELVVVIAAAAAVILSVVCSNNTSSTQAVPNMDSLFLLAEFLLRVAQVSVCQNV